jgi:hypothetical protein
MYLPVEDKNQWTLEMAAAEPNGLDTIPEFLRELFYPSALGSFRDSMPSGELTVYLHTAPGAEPKELTLKRMFPFMTLQDIKIALYIELKKAEEALPEFVYLCIHNKGAHRDKTTPIDFAWNQPNTDLKMFNFSPFELAVGSKPVDSRFVDSTGERKLVSIVARERITIEEAFFKFNITQGIPEFHAYLYKDLVAAIPGAKPPSIKDWNGRIYPFFPYLSSGEVATEEQKAKAERLSVVFHRRQQFVSRLQELLDENIALIPITLAGVKFLRLTWSKSKKIPVLRPSSTRLL